MSEALTIRQIGNSSGVVLPKELLERLKLERGDKLFVTYVPDGIVLRSFDENFARQMEVAREVMRKDRAILRELAK
ncbi:MAG: AbrB/MazE/SpoVT family DNA-binding domain-containing protein [Xanthomonadales bacterium]|jgi:putative addiction module antidote|nr:AbrB/MazE/SpoVT family DNA-binding domain-containing protein [Xanthomonadales bacterium]